MASTRAVSRREVLCRVAGLTGVALLSGCGGASQAAPSTKLAGTQLNGKPTPELTLVDHSGQSVSLSSLRGKPVVLTFLYTYCPDTCPVVMEKFARLNVHLGSQAEAVAFVAVSVDPERDTPERVDQFLNDRDLKGVVSFLTGERASLEAAWKAYYVGVSRMPIKAGSPESRRYGAYAIGHSDAIYVIDKVGRQRAFMRSEFALDDLLANLETLLRE